MKSIQAASLHTQNQIQKKTGRKDQATAEKKINADGKNASNKNTTISLNVEGQDTVFISASKKETGSTNRTIAEQLESFRRMLEDSKKASKEGAKDTKDRMKALEIAARIMHGDKVPAKDEQFLMKVDMKLYMQAKTMQIPNEKPKEYDSIVEDEDEEKHGEPATAFSISESSESVKIAVD